MLNDLNKEFSVNSERVLFFSVHAKLNMQIKQPGIDQLQYSYSEQCDEERQHKDCFYCLIPDKAQLN